MLIVPLFAFAQIWDGEGANDNWSTDENWDPDSAPVNDGTAAVDLSGSTRSTPNVDVAYDIDTLLINTGTAFTLSGETLTLQGGLTKEGAETFDLQNNIVVGDAQTWTQSADGRITVSGDVDLGANTLTVDATNTSAADGFEISGGISGTGALVKDGTGYLVLSGANTFMGGTALNSGTLQGDLTSLASDTTISSGATLLFLNAGTGTFSNTLEGAGTVAFEGGGTEITLDSASTRSGGTVLDSGAILTVEDDLALGTGSLTVGASDGTLITSGGNRSLANDVSISSGGTATVQADSDTTLSGVISGDGGLEITGPQTLTLSGANTHSGGTTLSGGTLSIASDDNLGSGSVTIGNASLQTTQTLSASNAVILEDANSTVNVGADTTTTLTGVVSGAGTLNFAGDGTLVLTGTNTYSGGTQINTGTLQVSSEDNLGTGDVGIGNGVLRATNSFTTYNNLTVSTASSELRVDGSQTLTLNGDVNGPGTLNVFGGGTLVLGGSGSAATVLAEGTILAGADNVLAGGESFTVGGGTTLNLNGFNQTVGGLTMEGQLALNGGNLTVATSDAVELVGNVTGGSGRVILDGAGSLEIAGTASNFGGVDLINGATFRFRDDKELGSNASKTFGFDNGTLEFQRSTTSGIDTIIDAGGMTVTGGAHNVGLSGNLSGVGDLTKTGAGNLTLSGSNSGTGDLILNGGNLLVTSSGALGGSGQVVLNNGSDLIISSSMVTARGIDLSTGSEIRVDSNNPQTSITAEIGGSVSGTDGLTLRGSDTLVLSGINTFSGGVFVAEGGTLVATNDAGLGDASNTVNLTHGRLIADGTFTGVQDIVLTNAGISVSAGETFTHTGELSGTGALVKTGEGVLSLSGLNTYSGGTVLKRGTLEITDENQLGSGNISNSDNGPNNPNDDGTIRFGQSLTLSKGLTIGGNLTLDTQNHDVTFTGTGSSASFEHSVIKTGVGTLFLDSASYLGLNLRVNEGVIDVSSQNISINRLSVADTGVANLGSSTLTLGTQADNALYNSVLEGTLNSSSSSTIVLNDILTIKSGAETAGFDGDILINTGSLVLESSGLLNSGVVSGGNDGEFQADHAIDQTFLNIADQPNFTGTIIANADSANNLDLTGFTNGVQLGARFGSYATPGADLSGEISVASGGLILSGGRFNGVLRISGDISGSNGVTVQSGTHFLAGNNTSFSGGAIVEDGGALIFENAQSLGSGSLTAESGGYIGTGTAIDQDFLDLFDKANTSGVIGLNENSSNTLDLNGFHSDARLGSNNPNGVEFSGEITPQDNEYRFGGGNNGATSALGRFTVSSSLSGSSSLDADNLHLTLSGNNTFTGDIIATNAILELTGSNTFDGTYSLTKSTLRVGSVANLGTTNTITMDDSTFISSGTMTMGNDFVLIDSNINTIRPNWISVEGSETLTLEGNISGDSPLIFNGGVGANMIELDGLNTYTGYSHVNNATLVLGSADALGTSQILRASSNSTLDLNFFDTTFTQVSIYDSLHNSEPGALTVNNGTLTIDNTTDASLGSLFGTATIEKTGAGTLFLRDSNFSGGLDIREGTLAASGTISAGGVTLGDATLTSFTSTDPTINDIVSIEGTGSAQLGGNLNLAGGISGNQDVTVLSGSFVNLSGNSTHTGSIQVEGGLRISADINSDIALESMSGVLSGTGSTTGGLLVQNGGTLSPGNSAGTLTVGNTTFGPGGIYNFEIDDTLTSDLLVVNGDLNFTSTASNPFVFNVVSLSSGEEGFMANFEATKNYSWTMVSANSIIGFVSGIFDLNVSGFQNGLNNGTMFMEQSGNDLVLRYNTNIAVIPEPGTIFMMLLFAGAYGLVSKLRKR